MMISAATIKRKVIRLLSSALENPAEIADTVPAGNRLSCVVLSLGAPPELVDAVRSLENQSPKPEIVIINSGGGDAEAMIQAAGLDATVISTSRRLFAGGARNLGIAATNEPWVAFIASDLIAKPGWVAGRLAAHHAGTDVVSSAVSNLYPWNPFAIAGHMLTFPYRLPGTPPDRAHHFGASYARILFARFDHFRPDLRTGEDTEFHRRIKTHVRFAYRGDVCAAHRNPTTLRALLDDQFRRGRRRAFALVRINGQRPKLNWTPLKLSWRMFKQSLQGTSIFAWGALLWGLPWLLPASIARMRGFESAIKALPTNTPQPEDPGSKNQRLLCLIQFRNEKRYLPEFLENVAPHVDGIIALDDGSMDGSTELMESHPSVIELIRITPNNPHVWNELRNKRILVDAAGRHDADWLLALDADERIEDGFRERAEKELQRAEREEYGAYSVILRELWDSPDRYRVDGIWGKKRIARLFRYRSDHDFGAIALHGPWAPQNSRGPNGTFPHADLIIYHLKMIEPVDRENRKRRYFELDPEQKWQKQGYDYLTDEDGLVLESLPPDRRYSPLPQPGAPFAESHQQS